jgi:hypothetical protein
MIRIETMPVCDWWVLADTELGAVLPMLTPCADLIHVLAAFDAEGEFAGCWAALRMVHAEGVFIMPKHRGKTAVQRALWKGMKRVAREWGVTSVITAATEPTVKSLVQKRGTPLPASFVLEL